MAWIRFEVTGADLDLMQAYANKLHLDRTSAVRTIFFHAAEEWQKEQSKQALYNAAARVS